MLNSPLVNKLRRVAKTEGLGAILRGGVEHIGDAVRAFRYIARSPRPATLDALLDDPPKHCGRIIQPMQIRPEILELMQQVQALRPKVIVEIGTANGGTLFLWTRLAAPGATIISIDLPGGKWGDGYARWRSWLYRRFALPGQTIHLVRADSHDPATVEQVRGLIDQPVDFLFIDGDHSYAGVKQDFEQFAPLVQSGGLIALHDIARHRAEYDCHVDQFWAELQETGRTTELINHVNQGWAGIGILQR
jgi:predicted O-methyltransferase YrrM